MQPGAFGAICGIADTPQRHGRSIGQTLPRHRESRLIPYLSGLTMAYNSSYCASCGASGDVHEHHIVPRVHGGADQPTVYLCAPCHGRVHGRDFALDYVALQRVGIERARAEGKFKGRAPTARRKAPAVLQMKAQGLKPAEIIAKLGISSASYFRIIADPTMADMAT